MNDQDLHVYCEAWREWCRTRSYFIAPGAKNILARMQPSKVGIPPNAIMSSDMSFFNMAIHALADMNDPNTDCFVKYYWERARSIKTVAHGMGIHRVTFYERKVRFARRALSMSFSLKAAYEESQKQPEEAEAVD